MNAEANAKEGFPLRRRFLALFTALAGLLLASSYFMPALSCVFDDHPRVNPSVELRKYVRREIQHFAIPADWSRPVAEWLSNAVVYAAPYFLGLLLFIGAVTRLAGEKRLQMASAYVLAAFVAAVATAVLYCSLCNMELWDGEIRFSIQDKPIRSTLMPLVVLAYVMIVLRSRERSALGLGFVAALFCLGWWVSWTGMLEMDWEYGLTASFWATLAILLAIPLELAAATRTGYWRALAQLLSGRIKPFINLDGRCTGCGYLLTGLAEVGRCPECGVKFDNRRTSTFCRPPAPPPASPARR